MKTNLFITIFIILNTHDQNLFLLYTHYDLVLGILGLEFAYDLNFSTEQNRWLSELS